MNQPGKIGQSHSIYQWMWAWIVLLLCCWILLGFQPIARATIHQYPEGNEQVMERSLQTLRDGSDRAWQLVLFKRSKAGVTQSIHLRLVGFPGVAKLHHPGTLQIATLRGDKTWQASEVLANVPLVDYIGEYDLLEFTRQLQTEGALRLTLPSLKPVKLVLPPYVIKEWRQLVFEPSALSTIKL
jgi:hypothetical protein